MLNEFRSTYITWDKATRRIYSPITANESDESGRKLVVQIVNGGQVEDLTGATLHLYWETRDKLHDGLDVFKAVDLKNGEFELSYTTGMLSNKGVLNANLVLIDTVGRVVSERFKITVTEGIDNDAIQSENSFTSLTQALIDISNLEQKYAPRLNDLTAQLQQTMNKTAVTLSHQFADNTERDTYFTTNPVELVELTFIKVGTGYQQYINDTWEASSPVLPEAVNQIDDVNPLANKTYSSNKIETLIEEVGGGTSIDDSTNTLDSTWSSSKIDLTKANKTQEGWITPTLLNGWTVGGAGVKYMKDEFGVVRLDMSIVPGTGDMFVLPVGYRPNKTMDFPCQSGTGFGFIRINRFGSVQRSIGTGAYVLAHGITFRAEE